MRLCLANVSVFSSIAQGMLVEGPPGPEGPAVSVPLSAPQGARGSEVLMYMEGSVCRQPRALLLLDTQEGCRELCVHFLVQN